MAKLHEKVKIGKSEVAIRSTKVKGGGLKITATLKLTPLISFEEAKIYPGGDASLDRRQEVFMELDESRRSQNMLNPKMSRFFDERIAPLLNEMFRILKLN